MPSPSLLDRAERRFGHLAIPGLLRVIASFQALCFILIHLNPPFRDALVLSPAVWQKWEIWRLFTFCFIPQSDSIIWIIFAIFILIRIGDALEQAWGKFRINLYFAASVAALWAAMAVMGPDLREAAGRTAGSMLYTSLFLAFATVVPNYTFLIFFVFPVKVKWLAVIDAGYLLFLFVTISVLRLPMVVALLPYACFGLPILLRNIRNANRRAEFKANALPTGDPFHQCAVCHRTDHSDPTLEFRIAGDDKEYCADHLPK
ncbi:MAG: hypothetical protein V4726_16835 [Verrucomicrobiota bacterium]